MAKRVALPPQRAKAIGEPSKEVYLLMEAFADLNPEKAPEVLAEFLERIELRAIEQSEELLARAAIMDRVRSVAARRSK